METGRPLLLAPPAVPASLGDAVLLAGTRARRPRARRPARFPSCSGPGRSSSCRSATPRPAPNAGRRSTRALAWHGRRGARHLEQGQRRVRDVLLVEAEAMGADLLVIGAYSHSRMRQVVFGGVTEHVLDHAELAGSDDAIGRIVCSNGRRACARQRLPGVPAEAAAHDFPKAAGARPVEPRNQIAAASELSCRSPRSFAPRT